MTTTYDVPQSVLDNQRKRALAAGQPQPCGEGVGNGLTCREYPTRLYTRGWRCTTHQPPANPAPDPARTVAALRARADDPPPAVRAIRAQFPVDSGKFPVDTIDERFRVFDAANPHVRARLLELVEHHVSQGARRLSIGALFEELRGTVETTGRPYALDNSLRAPMVRALIADQPEYADLFELRQRRSA